VGIKIKEVVVEEGSGMGSTCLRHNRGTDRRKENKKRLLLQERLSN